MSGLLGRFRRGVETSLTDDALRDGGEHLLLRLQREGVDREELDQSRSELTTRLAQLTEQQMELRTILMGVARMEADLTRREQYAANMWSARLGEISTSLDRDRREGTLLWVNAYVGALLDEAFDECVRLARADLDLDDEGWPGQRALLEAAVLVRADRDADQVLDWLTHGAPIGGSDALSDGTGSRVHVLRARLSLQKLPWDANQKSDGVQIINRYLDHAAGLDPNSALPEACRSALVRATGDLDDAIVAADEARYADPDAPDGDLEEAIGHYESGRSEDADRIFMRAASALVRQPAPALSASSWLRSQHPLLDLHLALILQSEYRLGEARAALRPPQTRSPIRAPKARIAAAPMTEAQILDALEKTGHTVDQHDRYRARLTAGKDLYFDHQYDRAREQLLLAREALPTDPESYWYSADIELVTSGTDEPPFVDVGKVEEAVKLWSKGETFSDWKARPSERWALSSRALMAEQEARSDPERRQEFWWRAVIFTDRALHYRPKRGVSWALLSRYLRYTGFAWAAKTAAEKALEMLPGDPTVLEQGIIVSISFGKLDRALSLLAERRELRTTRADEPWHQAVEASILMRLGEYRDALSLVDAALSVDQRVWYRDVAARLAIIAGDPDSMDRIQFVLEARDDLDLENYDSFIWAAIYAGDISSATEMLAFADATGSLAPVAIAELEAQLLLAKGELEKASVAFHETIDQAINPGDLETFGTVDFQIIRTFAESWGHPEKIEKLLTDLEDQAIPDRLDALTRQEEYPLLHDVAQHSAPGSWEHTGACVSLARMLGAENKWLEAADWYKRVIDDDQYPEAASALLEAYRAGASVAEGAGDVAANSAASAMVLSAGGSVVEAATSQARAKLNDATDMSAGAVAPPIRVTLAEGMIPDGEDWDQGHVFFEDHLPKARSRVADTSGWPIPGVRVYNDPAAQPGQYQIEIPDEPPAQGFVELSSYFCPTPDQLPDLEDEDRYDVDSPPILGVAAGAWVREERAPEIPPTVELWSLWEYVARHVEFVCSANLGSLVTLDGIASWVSDRVPDELAAAALPDVDAYVRLGAVVRSLLDDEIPVSKAEDLVRSFAEANTQPDPDLIANEVRRTLAYHFTVDDQRVITVPPEMEQTLASLSGHSGMPAPSERAVLGTIEAVGSRVVESPNRTIIATDDPLARLQLTALVDAVDPAVRVAMTSELPADASPSEQEILLGPDFATAAQRFGDGPSASATSFEHAVGIFNQAAMNELRRRVAEAIAAGKPHEDRDVADEAYALGYYLFTAGAYERAREAMTFASSAKATAQNLRAAGISEQQLGNFPVAIDFYRNAMSADPDDFLSLLFLAESLLQTDEPDEAVELLENASSLVERSDPDNAFANRIRSLLDFQRGAANESRTGC